MRVKQSLAAAAMVLTATMTSAEAAPVKIDSKVHGTAVDQAAPLTVGGAKRRRNRAAPGPRHRHAASDPKCPHSST